MSDYKFTGIVETALRKEAMLITLIDVGGQRSERKKWMHCFDNINAVLFMVAMSEYDQTLKEDGKTNRMKESIRLFGTVCHNQWFKRSSMLLFLNKKDVFDQKIKYSPLSKYFNDYNNEKEESSFIVEKFKAATDNDRSFYRHFTCAKDSYNISVVFQVTIDLIKQRNMRYCGMS